MDLTLFYLPTTAALALVALLGYRFGRRSRRPAPAQTDQTRREVKRALNVANELEQIATAIQSQLTPFQTAIANFRHHVSDMGCTERDEAWQELCRHAGEILLPTMRLASQMGTAYDSIRQQSHYLMSFTESRTDALTHVYNRRAMDESLKWLLSLWDRYQQPFSVVLLDVDHFKRVNDEFGHIVGDQLLQNIARVIDERCRETDIVSRFGGEEFLIAMPMTAHPGALIAAEAIREAVKVQTSATISVGVATVRDLDATEALVQRADAAMYAAKDGGRDTVFGHDGLQISKYRQSAATAMASPILTAVGSKSLLTEPLFPGDAGMSIDETALLS